MTPTSIRTGKGFDSRVSSVSCAADSIASVVGADANRVGLVVSVGSVSVAGFNAMILVGPVIGGVVVPLTTLSPGHPVCYLSVDKIGSAIMQAISVYNGTGGALTFGVTEVRQVQELPE